MHQSHSRAPAARLAALPLALRGDSGEVRAVRAALEAFDGSPLLIGAEEGLELESIGRYLHARSATPGTFRLVDCTAAGVEEVLLGARGTPAADAGEVLGRRSPLVDPGVGTVFLRHIGDLPSSAQRRLARVLRDGEASVGRGRTRRIARVVACAVPGVDAEAREGRLRPDLLRRFGPVHPQVPALRARPEDLAEIVQRATAEVAAGMGRPSVSLTRAAITVLAALPWPGNLRELRASLERIIRDAAHDTIRQEDVLEHVAMHGDAVRVPATVTLREARRRFERQYIAAVLEQHGWRMSDAARTLGIERANLYRKTRQLGIARRLAGRIADAS